MDQSMEGNRIYDHIHSASHWATKVVQIRKHRNKSKKLGKKTTVAIVFLGILLYTYVYEAEIIWKVVKQYDH